MPQTKASDYSEELTTVCKSVLLELHRILGSFWDHIVIVGGWVPTLLANNTDDPHKGTADIDLALNHLLIPDEAYATIHELLLSNNYVQNTDKAKQFQYFRSLTIDGIDRTVILDLLTGQYDVESGKDRRHEPIQDVKALKARGVDLAFTRFEVVKIDGELPDKGGHDCIELKVASVAPIMVMKCSAISNRLKDKDSYDLYYFVKNYKGGLADVLTALKPDVKHGLVTEAIEKIRHHFQAVNSSGPSQVVRFLEIDDENEMNIVKRDVFETMQNLLSGVDQLVNES